LASIKWHNCVDSSGVWQYSVRDERGVVLYELIHLESGVSYTSGADAAHWFQWPPNPESEVPTGEYNPEHPISDLLYECIARVWREIKDGTIVGPSWEVTA